MQSSLGQHHADRTLSLSRRRCSFAAPDSRSSGPSCRHARHRFRLFRFRDAAFPVGHLRELTCTCKSRNSMSWKWCCKRGSNSRPLPYQGSALPLSYCSGSGSGLCRTSGKVTQGSAERGRSSLNRTFAAPFAAADGPPASRLSRPPRRLRNWLWQCVETPQALRRDQRRRKTASPRRCAKICAGARPRSAAGGHGRTAKRGRMRAVVIRVESVLRGPSKSQSWGMLFATAEPALRSKSGREFNFKNEEGADEARGGGTSRRQVHWASRSGIE
jgi:hypothetical protein